MIEKVSDIFTQVVSTISLVVLKGIIGCYDCLVWVFLFGKFLESLLGLVC